MYLKKSAEFHLWTCPSKSQESPNYRRVFFRARHLRVSHKVVHFIVQVQKADWECTEITCEKE